MRESQFLGLVRKGCTSKWAVAYDPVLKVGRPAEK